MGYRGDFHLTRIGKCVRRIKYRRGGGIITRQLESILKKGMEISHGILDSK